MTEDVPIFQTMVMENPNPEGSARLVRARSQQGKEQSHEAATSPLWRARLASIDRKVHLACNGDVGWRTRFSDRSHKAAALHLDWVSSIMTGCAGSRHGGRALFSTTG